MLKEKKHLSKTEIEESIKGKDDFVKINYLQRFLEKADNLEIKKFILLNLAGINESKAMFREAIKNVSAAAEISITYREKIEFYMKETEIWIKLLDFDRAEKAFKKAQFYGNSQERIELQKKYLEVFRMQASIFENNNKTRNALSVYERLLSLVQRDNSRKMEVEGKLIELYEKLGRMKEAGGLRKMVGKNF